MNLQATWSLVRQTVEEFLEDDALRLSAALAYYTVFSLAPLLLIAIAGAVAGDAAVRGQLDGQLRSSLGPSGAFAVQEMVANARKPAENLVMSAAGIVMLLVGAGGMFGELQDALNTVWGVKRKPGRGIKGILKDRFLSFTMVLGTGFLLLVSMLLSTALQSLTRYMGSIASLPPQLWEAINAAFSFGVVTILFAAIFKVLPDLKIRWKDVWAGGLFTSALFVLGKTAMGWYLGRQATASSYGSAGALALVLIWIYYSSMILLLGAEFTQVLAKRRGSVADPAAP